MSSSSSGHGWMAPLSLLNCFVSQSKRFATTDLICYPTVTAHVIKSVPTRMQFFFFFFFFKHP
jgi:hypothetical protein